MLRMSIAPILVSLAFTLSHLEPKEIQAMFDEMAIEGMSMHKGIVFRAGEGRFKDYMTIYFGDDFVSCKQSDFIIFLNDLRDEN